MEIIEEHFSKIMKICREKGIEYANSDEDANMNFKQIGKDLGIDPKMVLWIYVTKHIRAVEQFIRTGVVHSSEGIEGRIHDIILYNFILLTMLEDEKPLTIDDGAPF